MPFVGVDIALLKKKKKKRKKMCSGVTMKGKIAALGFIGRVESTFPSFQRSISIFNDFSHCYTVSLYYTFLRMIFKNLLYSYEEIVY